MIPTATLTLLDSRPFADGKSFGETGPFVRIKARAHLQIDPALPCNREVIDIDLAPRNAQGRVEIATDVWLLRPQDMRRGNGAVLFEFPNRGNKRSLQFFNDAPGTNDPISLSDAGNGFLMRQGYTVVSAAWQADVLAGDGRMVFDCPVARQDGRPVSAPVRAEFICDTPGVTCLPLSGKQGTRSWPSVSLDTRTAEFRRRRYPGSPAQVIDPSAWQFALVQGGGRGAGQGDVTGGECGIVPSACHIHHPAGFEPGWIYELVYTAQDPQVLELGLCAVRDLVLHLRDARAPDNPLAQDGQAPRYVHAWGRSQAGRCIRDFVYRGFNAREAGGPKVFDGVMPHVSGAGRTNMNRFSNLVIPASRQYEDWLHPADRFPFSYAATTDHLSGRTDAILKRPGTDPLVIHTQTASEYWYRRGSLVHTDTEGRDLAQPESVRIYFWSSSQHWADPGTVPLRKGICTQYQNVVATSALFRGVLTLMDDWVRRGVAPPPSRVPLRGDGSLTDMPGWRAGFPAIPGVALPAAPNLLPLIDYGPAFAQGGPLSVTPQVDGSRHYAVLVPAVDTDGNDIAGVRAPMVAAPLGSYTGWNLRIAGFGGGALHDFSGSYLPFSDTAMERALWQDPRLSILERYGHPEAYVQAIRRAAQSLVDERLMLQEDVERAVEQAANWGRPRHLNHLTAFDT